jgi:transcriptional regulator with XRE-family HTH domain
VLAIDARISRTLRDLRKQRKLTQSALAPILGVSFQQIQKFEHGVNRLSVAQLLAAARHFEVGLEYFLPELHAQGRAGEAALISDNELAKFAASSRGANLIRAFLQIREPHVRAAVERLIRALTTDDPTHR